MPISSVSQAGALPYIAAPSAAKSSPDADNSSAAAPSASAPSAAASPAKSDNSAKSATPDRDAPSAEASGSKNSSAAPNMFKINPDGTVGPLHQRRHANSSVHA